MRLAPFATVLTLCLVAPPILADTKAVIASLGRSHSTQVPRSLSGADRTTITNALLALRAGRVAEGKLLLAGSVKSMQYKGLPRSDIEQSLFALANSALGLAPETLARRVQTELRADDLRFETERLAILRENQASLKIAFNGRKPSASIYQVSTKRTHGSKARAGLQGITGSAAIQGVLAKVEVEIKDIINAIQAMQAAEAREQAANKAVDTRILENLKRTAAAFAEIMSGPPFNN